MRHPMIDETEGTRSSQSGFSIIELIIVVVIIMVLAGMAAKWMSPAIRSYRLSGTAFEIAATARLARIKATTGDARYRTLVNTTARTYQVQRYPRGGTGWLTFDVGAASQQVPWPSNLLAAGVNFSTTGISAAPPGQSTTQATDMVFNTRGLLINPSTGVPVNGRCFYLQGDTDRPLAVCANLAGKVTVYRRFGSVWEVQ